MYKAEGGKTDAMNPFVLCKHFSVWNFRISISIKKMKEIICALEDK